MLGAIALYGLLMMGTATSKPDHAGHRQRLRERFLKGGGETLPDYELLELLLFNALPRRDTKPLAKALLRRFPGFAAIIGADPEELREVDGVGDSVIVALKIVDAAAIRVVREDVMDRPVLGNWQRLMEYCHAALGRNRIESFRILFMNRRNELIADEEQQRGTIDHTPVYPREVVKRALELQAAAIIMVHNHPSGNATPSQADIKMTHEIKEIAGKLGIVLHDHVIVARKGSTSFRQAGLL